MPTVYITQEPGQKDLRHATKYGDLITLLGEHNQAWPNSESVLTGLYKALEKFNPKVDYVLLIGDPIAIAMVSFVALDLHGEVCFLKWDRRSGEYYPIWLRQPDAKTILESSERS